MRGLGTVIGAHVSLRRGGVSGALPVVNGRAGRAVPPEVAWRHRGTVPTRRPWAVGRRSVTALLDVQPRRLHMLYPAGVEVHHVSRPGLPGDDARPRGPSPRLRT